ncbi:MAG: CGNR zinc finger domain-containing protein [Chloroflexota bacterium]
MGDAAGIDREGFHLQGKQLCLEFANTADWHDSAQPEEGLTSYADLVGWSSRQGVLSEGEAERLLQEAARRPGEAASVLARGIGLREAIFRIISAITAGLPPRQADLDTLNASLSAALARLRVTATGGDFLWSWAGSGEELDRVLWPVAASAGELLTSDGLGRVRKCAGDPCGWLFLDTSRNQSRRWCDMKSCGNRAKARRHYGRKRAAQVPAS